MTTEPLNPKERNAKRSRDLLKRALITVREARRCGQDLEPDTDIKAMWDVVEEYLGGLEANLKAWEAEDET
jgi:hypothetical protein